MVKSLVRNFTVVVVVMVIQGTVVISVVVAMVINGGILDLMVVVIVMVTKEWVVVSMNGWVLNQTFLPGGEDVQKKRIVGDKWYTEW